MTIVTTVTKNIIHRAWSDLEPKLLTFLATGLTSSFLIAAADYVGYKLSPGLAAVVVVVVSSVFGYIKSSTTKVPAFSALSVKDAVASPTAPVA